MEGASMPAAAISCGDFQLAEPRHFSAPVRTVFSGSGNPIGSAGSITSTLTSAKSRQIHLA